MPSKTFEYWTKKEADKKASSLRKQKHEVKVIKKFVPNIRYVVKVKK